MSKKFNFFLNMNENARNQFNKMKKSGGLADSISFTSKWKSFVDSNENSSNEGDDLEYNLEAS